jgi:hypothetical protein
MTFISCARTEITGQAAAQEATGHQGCGGRSRRPGFGGGGVTGRTFEITDPEKMALRVLLRLNKSCSDVVESQVVTPSPDGRPE